MLFILKRRSMTSDEYGALHKEYKPNFTYCLSSGLRNSAMFVVDMLNDNDIEAKLVEVVDNNCIDREVTAYKPTHVIIEAFWVVPEKFTILNKLHPGVKWIVRNHSEFPFLANEGIAMDWSMKYLTYPNVFLAPNSRQTFTDTLSIATAAYGEAVANEKVIFLPNFYKIQKEISPRTLVGDFVNVGCFGAIRPLKNHLVQAIAAIKFADKRKKKLRFHINVARLEDAGNNVLKAIHGVFDNLDPKQYELVEHGWLNHDDFLDLANSMDIGLQCSFTESFNIVTADFVSQGVPVVTSKEVEWLPEHFTVDEVTNSDEICDKMCDVMWGYRFWRKAQIAVNGLIEYNDESCKIWTRMFRDPPVRHGRGHK